MLNSKIRINSLGSVYHGREGRVVELGKGYINQVVYLVKFDGGLELWYSYDEVEVIEDGHKEASGDAR